MSSEALTFKEKLDVFIRTFEVNTYLHGFKKISTIHSNFARKTFYVMFYGLVIFCIYLIVIQLQAFQGNVTHVRINSWGYAVWENPFPAVTICNVNTVYKKKTKKFVDILIKYGYSSKLINSFLLNLRNLINCDNCNNYLVDYVHNDLYKKLFHVLESEGFSVDKIMRELAHPCDTMITDCKWISKPVACKELFKLIKTSSGYCCSFNYFGSIDVQPDLSREESYRYYAGFQGEYYGIDIVLNVESEQYFAPLKPFVGFYILAADGYEVPYAITSGTKVRQGELMKMGLIVNSVLSDYDVRYLIPTNRECMFRDEGQLEQTKIYTFENCIDECRTKAIYKYCKCVPYYRSIKGGRRLCTLEDTPCLIKFEVKYANLVIANADDEEGKLSRRVSSDSVRCACLPNCNEITYDVDVDIDNITVYEEYKQKPNLTVARVFYNSIAGANKIRSVTLPWDYLLALVGGIFSFCMSASIVTVFEIIYCFIYGMTYKPKNKKSPSILQVKPNH